MAIGTLAAFWAVSFLLVLVPGADWAYAIAAGLRDRSVLPAVAGLLAGYAGLTAVVAAGVAAVITRSPLALTAGPGAHRQLRRRLHQRGRHRGAGTAGTACRRHGGDPVFGSRDDDHRRPSARRAPAHLTCQRATAAIMQSTRPLKVTSGPRRLPGIRLVCISGPPDRRRGNHTSMAELEEQT
jgi:hypothetical protein